MDENIVGPLSNRARLEGGAQNPSAQSQFVMRALAARERAIETGVYVPAEVVLEKLAAARDAAKRHKR